LGAVKSGYSSKYPYTSRNCNNHSGCREIGSGIYIYSDSEYVVSSYDES